MAECVLPERDHRAPSAAEGIPLETATAREWAVQAGYATFENGSLQPVGDVDTVGKTVITIGNSERPVENFELVHKIIATANRGGVTPSHSALFGMVEAADYMFGPMPEWDERQAA